MFETGIQLGSPDSEAEARGVRTSYDFIGDVHGQIGKLRGLLQRLGYREAPEGWMAPEGVTAVFLGDLIDPKPSHPSPGGVRECLRVVKSMCDRGQAVCLLGNHELNALHFHTPGLDGLPLRANSEKNVRQHRGTLDDFPDHADPEGEWRTIWLPWFRERPLFFEAGGVRAVHACWYPRHLRQVEGQSLADPAFLKAVADRSTPEGEALEVLLKGIELPIPGGGSFVDHTGSERHHFRVRWWENPGDGVVCRDLVFPANREMPGLPMDPEDLADLPSYPEDAPPLFFGHYLKPPEYGLKSEAPNVACLDYSAAKGGPLVAYWWRGEQIIDVQRFVKSSDQDPRFKD